MSKELFSLLKSKHNIIPTEQQKAAILHTEGPRLLLAVAGAGKTTSVCISLANLIINHGVSPKNILVMSFSRASAGDLKERFSKLFGDMELDGITFSTIHSFALSVIRNYERMSGIKYTIIEDMSADTNKISLLKKIYRDINKEFINDDKLEELCNAIGYIKNAMVKDEDIDALDIKVKGFREIYKTYNRYIRNNRLIDFDEMLLLAYELLLQNPRLTNYYRNQYTHVVVDEYQDTAVLQNCIIKHLVYPNENLCVVGDDDQSIYKFRGVDVRSILNFSKIYPSSQIYFMEQNFRSTRNIVDLANGFIKINKERYSKNMFTDKLAGEPVKIVKVKDEIAEVNYIIEQLKGMGSLKDAAVLFRNNITAVPLVDALERNNIPFYIKDSNIYLFSHWVTQDISSFLSLALINNDIPSFERIYYRMNAYLSKSVIDYIKSSDTEMPVFDTLIKCPQLTDIQKDKVNDLKIKFQILAEKKPLDAIDYIYNELKYRDYLRNNGVDAGYSLDNLETIVSLLKCIAANTNTIPAFLNRLTELQNILENSKFNHKKDAVTLITCHSSKGLEFPSVFMIGMVDGEFPSFESITKYVKDNNAALIEEEARLFYVALTRAQKNLHIIVIENKFGNKVSPSRFVERIERLLNPDIKDRVPKVDSGMQSGKTDEDPTEYDDRFFWLRKPDKTGSKANTHELKVGSNITHNKFGNGTVLSINNGKMDVRFDQYGIKTLLIGSALSFITIKD